MELANGRYNMILGRDLLTSLWLNLQFSEHVIQEYDGPLKVLTAPTVDSGKYQFKYLNTGKITIEESFMNMNDYMENIWIITIQYFY